MRNPQWDQFEARFGYPPPHALRRLHADLEMLLTDDLIEFVVPGDDEVWDVSSFASIDRAEFEAGWNVLDPDLFEMASDGFGNPFLIRITGDVNDPCPVWFWMHDGGTNELEVVCPTLDEFHMLLRNGLQERQRSDP